MKEIPNKTTTPTKAEIPNKEEVKKSTTKEIDIQNRVISLEEHSKLLTERIFNIFQTMESILHRISNTFSTLDTDITKYREVVYPLYSAFNNEFMPKIAEFRNIPSPPEEAKRKTSDNNTGDTVQLQTGSESNWIKHINKKKKSESDVFKRIAPLRPSANE